MKHYIKRCLLSSFDYLGKYKDKAYVIQKDFYTS